MKPETITKYVDQSVRITYDQPKINGGDAQDSRTGILTTVSITKAALLLFTEDSEDEIEVFIPIKDIKQIHNLKAKD